MQALVAVTLTHRGQESSRQRIKQQQDEAQRSEWGLRERKRTEEGGLVSPEGWERRGEMGVDDDFVFCVFL